MTMQGLVNSEVVYSHTTPDSGNHQERRDLEAQIRQVRFERNELGQALTEIDNALLRAGVIGIASFVALLILLTLLSWNLLDGMTDWHRVAIALVTAGACTLLLIPIRPFSSHQERTASKALRIHVPLIRTFKIDFSGSGALFAWQARKQCQAKIQTKDKEITDVQNQLADLFMITRAGRRDYLQRELRHVSDEAARECLGSKARQELNSRWRTQAQNLLDEVDLENNQSEYKLSEAQLLITTIEETTLLERSEKQGQWRWQMAVLILMVVYILLITAPIWTSLDSNMLLPVYNVPLWVIMWGAAGSLAAILYRFYSEEGRVNFNRELRWLIARPITGIIMSAVVYATVFSGLLLLNDESTVANLSSSNNQIARLSVLAFLAGFSDKFYNSVIGLLVTRTVSSTAERNEDKMNRTGDYVPGV